MENAYVEISITNYLLHQAIPHMLKKQFSKGYIVGMKQAQQRNMSWLNEIGAREDQIFSASSVSSKGLVDSFCGVLWQRCR
jgi:hypothetical protein